jgi:hypothetical protein
MFLVMTVLSVLAAASAACAHMQLQDNQHQQHQRLTPAAGCAVTSAYTAARHQTWPLSHLCVCSPLKLDAQQGNLCWVTKDEILQPHLIDVAHSTLDNLRNVQKKE